MRVRSGISVGGRVVGVFSFVAVAGTFVGVEEMRVNVAAGVSVFVSTASVAGAHEAKTMETSKTRTIDFDLIFSLSFV